MIRCKCCAVLNNGFVAALDLAVLRLSILQAEQLHQGAPSSGTTSSKLAASCPNCCDKAPQESRCTRKELLKQELAGLAPGNPYKNRVLLEAAL